ncbi:hypothetical protein BKA67DRAFT_508781, partial [Truncatella angustata]
MLRKEPELCTLCREINLEDLKSDHGFLHHSTCDSLVQSAHTCDLCKSITNLFIRSIHMYRSIIHPIRSIYDCSRLGPIALHAACRDLDSDRSSWARIPGPVLSSKLSLQVAVTLGPTGDRVFYGAGYPTLSMFCDPGSIAEGLGVVGLS